MTSKELEELLKKPINRDDLIDKESVVYKLLKAVKKFPELYRHIASEMDSTIDKAITAIQSGNPMTIAEWQEKYLDPLEELLDNESQLEEIVKNSHVFD